MTATEQRSIIPTEATEWHRQVWLTEMYRLGHDPVLSVRKQCGISIEMGRKVPETTPAGRRYHMAINSLMNACMPNATDHIMVREAKVKFTAQYKKEKSYVAYV